MGNYISNLYSLEEGHTFNELGNILANEQGTLAMGICPDGANLVVQLLCSCNYVRREYIFGQIHEGWVLHYCSDLYADGNQL
jgi:hypothetical protein